MELGSDVDGGGEEGRLRLRIRNPHPESRIVDEFIKHEQYNIYFDKGLRVTENRIS